jgi:protein tyrosine phosphatase (PTP) superfamily phosphohydrolase (DUF442 family)
MPLDLKVSACSLPVAGNVCINLGAFVITAQPIYSATVNPYQAIAQFGIKSVLCVRDPQEVIVQPNPFDLTESQELILNGVTYTNVPMPHITMTQQQFNAQAYNAATVIDGWPKPILIHCSSGDRASAMFAAYLIAYRGVSNGEAVEFATKSLALQNQQFVGYVIEFQKP